MSAFTEQRDKGVSFLMAFLTAYKTQIVCFIAGIIVGALIF